MLLWVVALPVAAGAASEPLGPVFRVDSTPGYTDVADPHGPSVATATTGRFVVVWQSTRDYWHVRARRYDGTGVPQGEDFSVAGSEAAEYSRAPDVALAPDGGFLVVWQGAEYQREILGRTFDAAGTPRGDVARVNTTGESGPEAPKVAAVGTEGFVVVWGQYDYTGSIRGQRLDPDGDPIGGELVISSVGEQGYEAETSDHDDIAVAASADGDFMVVWKGYGILSGQPTVFGRHFDAFGNPTGPEEELVDTSGVAVARHVAVAVRPDDGFVVTWSGRADYGEYGIFGLRLDADGDVVGGAFPIAARSESGEEATHPEVSTGSSGGFVVVWREEPYGEPAEIRGRELDDAGTPVGPEFVLPKFDEEDPEAPAMPDLARDDSADVVTAWVDLVDHQVLARQLGTPNEPGCTAAPRLDCRQPSALRTSVVKILGGSPAPRRKILWRWVKGDETLSSALGDPVDETSFALCLYDSSGAPQPRMLVPIDAGGLCEGEPCWRGFGGTRFAYSNRTLSESGVRLLDLTPGDAGDGKIKLLAKGADAPVPAMPFSLPVAVQLQASNGQCWAADYGAFVSANDPTRFIARSGILP